MNPSFPESQSWAPSIQKNTVEVQGSPHPSGAGWVKLLWPLWGGVQLQLGMRETQG